jgi:hypothetical protein
MDPIASINIYLPHDYPFDTPVFELCVDWLSSDESTFIMTQLEGIVESEVGEVILFQIISWLREYFDELLEAKAELELTGRLVAENDIEIENGDAVNVVSVSPPKSITPKIVHGEPLTDRKSVFVAHAALVHSVEQVHSILFRCTDVT